MPLMTWLRRGSDRTGGRTARSVRLELRSLDERVMPDASPVGSPESEPAAAVATPAEEQPAPAPAPRPAAPTLQDILTEARKNSEVRSLLDGGWSTLGTKPTVRAATAAEVQALRGHRGGYDPAKSLIVLNLNALPNAAEGAGTLLYELLRFKHRDMQKALDDKAYKGEMSEQDYVIANEKLSYEIAKEHHKIASGFQGAGKWSQGTDHHSDIDKYMSFEDYFKKKNDPNKPADRQRFQTHLQAFGDAYRDLRDSGKSKNIKPNYSGRPEPFTNPPEEPSYELPDDVPPDDDLSDDPPVEDETFDQQGTPTEELYALHDDFYSDGWWDNGFDNLDDQTASVARATQRLKPGR